ncbi:MAG: hypothetical protein JXA71_06520 [Chitinispirillaceae bacterium]|nr:hypothetical protein [Chitinispirillaceae bacterium]
MQAIIQTPTLLFLLLTLIGCAPSILSVKPHVPSTFRYQTRDTLNIRFIDNRRGFDTLNPAASFGTEDNKLFVCGFGNGFLFLKNSLVEELTARGIVVTETENEPLATLEINKYQLLYTQGNADMPWESFLFFKGRITHGGKSDTLASFFYKASPLGWSREDVYEHCMNIPLSLLVLNIASKIHAVLFTSAASSSDVERLTQTCRQHLYEKPSGPYRQLFELGGTGSRSAVDSLKKLETAVSNFFVKSVIVTAVAQIADEGNAAYLTGLFERYAKRKEYLTKEEKITRKGFFAMLLRGIAEQKTPSSSSFLSSIRETQEYATMLAVKKCVDFYLDDPVFHIKSKVGVHEDSSWKITVNDLTEAGEISLLDVNLHNSLMMPFYLEIEYKNQVGMDGAFTFNDSVARLLIGDAQPLPVFNLLTLKGSKAATGSIGNALDRGFMTGMMFGLVGGLVQIGMNEAIRERAGVQKVRELNSGICRSDTVSKERRVVGRVVFFNFENVKTGGPLMLEFYLQHAKTGELKRFTIPLQISFADRKKLRKIFVR